MVDHPNKRQKVSDDITTCTEEVLFNTDILSKVISYLPSIDLLNLGLTCKRFGVSNTDDNSIIKESASVAIKNIASQEQLAALPHHDGENSLANYHYLQLLQAPLTFDQLVDTDYVDTDDKTCVRHSGIRGSSWETAFSNNILRRGKHYASFTVNKELNSLLFVGLMRPGQANQNTSEAPLHPEFFQHFSQRMGGGEHNNDNINCCMYTICGRCYTSDWIASIPSSYDWVGSDFMSSGDEIGMLLNLDEGILSVYKNGRKLGIMKRGLAGHYCWAVSLCEGSQVTIKRGTIPRV